MKDQKKELKSQQKMNRPMLNKDISVHIVKSGIFLRNTKSGVIYHVGKMEYAILSTFDGNHSVDELKVMNSKYMKEKQFEEFVFYANVNGLLESSEKKGKAIQITKLKKSLFCPMKLLHDGLFVKLIRIFLIVGSLVSFGILAKFISARTELVFQALFENNYLHMINILYYFTSIFVIGFFHEIAHAVMIISFGGNVFEVGVMLNYFHPAFYVDITGVEQLKSKASRICVWLAGIMSEIIIAFPMMILAFYEKSPFFLNAFFIIFNVINVSMILFNMLFVIKLDGYYILSELLEINALREKSISCILNGFTDIEIAQNSILERLIFIILGVIMVAYLPLFIMRMIIMGINHFVPTMMPIASRIMLVWGILGITLFIVRGIGARIMPYLRGRRIKDA